MTAWAAVFDRGRVAAGSRVFINGCSGAVGASAVQMAIARGARVAGTCGPASRQAVAAAGVAPLFGYDDRQAYRDAGPFDLVFDTLGTLPVGDGLAMLSPRGVLVDINPTAGRLARGMASRRYKLAFATMGIKDLPAIAELAAEGVLRPTVGREAPFSDALSAIARAEGGARPVGKTVLVF